MKKTLIILGVLVSIAIYGSAGAITVDGTFDTAEWAGSMADDDGVGSGGYVGPGWGGQSFDVEYLGLKVQSDGTVYFGLQTGFNLKYGVTYGGTHYSPGDFALDVNNDGVYDYAIDFSISGTTPSFALYQASTWQDVMYSAHAAANPYQLATGTLLPVSVTGAYGSGVYANNSDGGTSYVLEGSFNIGPLSGPITLHWTMECGNDYLNVTTTPVPEPSTILLLGTGLVGAALFRRRKVGARK